MTSAKAGLPFGLNKHSRHAIWCGPFGLRSGYDALTRTSRSASRRAKAKSSKSPTACAGLGITAAVGSAWANSHYPRSNFAGR